MTAYFTTEALTALFQVVMIDLVLAGDNAIVIGLAAAGLPQGQRTKVIFWGIAAATAMRIGFAGVTVQLLQIIGLLLAGGLLLLWVCWKMWRELRTAHFRAATVDAGTGRQVDFDGAVGEAAPKKTFGQAIWQIIVADVSMSLDNVLAVAGASRNYPSSRKCCRSIAGSPMWGWRSSSMWRSTCVTAAPARSGPTQSAWRVSCSPGRPPHVGEAEDCDYLPARRE
jgi:YjbE family integral membrane protein